MQGKRSIVKNGVKFAGDLAVTAVEGQPGNLREPFCRCWTVAHLFITTAEKEKTHKICLHRADKIQHSAAMHVYAQY